MDLQQSVTRQWNLEGIDGRSSRLPLPVATGQHRNEQAEFLGPRDRPVTLCHGADLPPWQTVHSAALVQMVDFPQCRLALGGWEAKCAHEYFHDIVRYRKGRSDRCRCRT